MKCTLEGVMKITTKELRIQPGKILDHVVNGQEVTVTFRGKALAKIVPIHKKDNISMQEDNGFFGMWNKHKEETTVEETVRELRKGRSF
jgi:prevent-host-death family protein